MKVAGKLIVVARAGSGVDRELVLELLRLGDHVHIVADLHGLGGF
jgi:NAD(P)-dependent dehydrogenase (short-subunit alcohol dehydrogenase family)